MITMEEGKGNVNVCVFGIHENKQWRRKVLVRKRCRSDISLLLGPWLEYQK